MIHYAGENRGYETIKWVGEEGGTDVYSYPAGMEAEVRELVDALPEVLTREEVLALLFEGMSLAAEYTHGAGEKFRRGRVGAPEKEHA